MNAVCSRVLRNHSPVHGRAENGADLNQQMERREEEGGGERRGEEVLDLLAVPLD